jgi:hypothetical protein
MYGRGLILETALREEGVEPTVVATPDDATGLAPLHTLKCLVVHVHGDYLNPTSMLNTPEELEKYAPSDGAKEAAESERRRVVAA